MKKRALKWLLGILTICALLISVQAYAAGFEPLADDDSDEGTQSEHWSISYAFIIDQGDGLATETSYADDLSDLDCGEISNFTVTAQINYRNTNQIIPYGPGELTLTVPNMMYGQSAAQVEENVIAFGLNVDDTGDYSWRLVNEGSDYISMPVFEFTNVREINPKENFEGSIQIMYSMNSLGETLNGMPAIEYGEEACLHAFTSRTRATLRTLAETIDSNRITYTYARRYEHPWENAKYAIDKQGTKLVSADGIADNFASLADFENYYWVRWELNVSVNKGDTLRYATRLALTDAFPDDCLVFDSQGSRLTPTAFNGEQTCVVEIDPPQPGGTKKVCLIVGYPKANYNAQNLRITNTAYVHAQFGQGYEYHDDDDDTVLIGDFEFQYPPGEYAIRKEATSPDVKYTQSLTGEDPGLSLPFTYELYPDALYTNFPMTVRVGDDMLFITDASGAFRRLEDSEYYFSSISFADPIYNGNNGPIKGVYDYELYVRRANSATQGFDAYEKVAEGRTDAPQTYAFTKADAVVAYYFNVIGMTESMSGDTTFRNTVVIDNAAKRNIRYASGTVYNFDYICVYDDQGVLQNEPTEDSYVEVGGTITKSVLAGLDRETYGQYMRRGADSDAYREMTYPEPQYYMPIIKAMTPKGFDDKLGGWPVSVKLSLEPACRKISDAEVGYLKNLPDEYKLLGFEFVDVLPDYTEIISTPEEIIASITEAQGKGGVWFYFYEPDGSVKAMDRSGFSKLCRENARVEIVENAGNEGPWLRVIIDFSEHPLVISGFWTNVPVTDLQLQVSFNFVYKYEGYLSDPKNGNTFGNDALGYYHDRKGIVNGSGYFGTFLFIPAKGWYVNEGVDYNGNGIAPEYAAWDDATAKVGVPSSSFTNLIKEVADEDDETEFTTGQVNVEYDAPYKYRLSIVTGNNRLTNIVLYDFLEEFAKDPDGNIVPSGGKRDFWTGTFVSLDASNALGKDYIDEVKLYYSEESEPKDDLYAADGALNPTWQPYQDGVTDRKKVASLAIEFLKNGQSATIPAMEKVSVTVNMVSPVDEDINYYAYNGAFTQWKALDQTGKLIPGVDGINSNIVTVALPNTGVAKPHIEIVKEQAYVIDGIPGTRTKDKLPVVEADVIRYYLTVTNTGNAVAQSVMVTDVIPEGLTLVEGSISDGGENYGNTIIWMELGPLDYREGANTRTVTFDVIVPRVEEGKTWVNGARVSYDDDGDPDTPRENEPSNEVEIEEPATKSGSLTVSKRVTGSDADRERAFTFQIAFSDGGRYPYTHSDGTSGLIGSGETFCLRDGERITIHNIPEGVEYTITELEANADGYITTAQGDSGVIVGDRTDAAIFVNAKHDKGVPGTGDSGKPLLWLALMAVSFAGIAYVRGLRRRTQCR